MDSLTPPSSAPKLFRGLVLAGSFSAVSLGLVAGINYALNHDQTELFPHGVIKYRKMDHIYAHTIITKGDPIHGKDYVVLERCTFQESRTYISKSGCSRVYTLAIDPGILRNRARKEYHRFDLSRAEEELFKTADAELQQQCRRFKPLMEK